MYQVIDVARAQTVHSKHDNFDDAIDEALALAKFQAEDEGIDLEEVSTWDNGDSPRENPDGNWEAGACPDGDDGAYWPHVIFKS
jgi:hypothetical protein